MITEKRKPNISKFLIEFFKPNKWKIIIILIFIFTASLSLFGIEPFAYYTTVGNVVTAKPSNLVTVPLYPLNWVVENTVGKISIDLGTGHIFIGISIIFFIIIIYYYLLSCLLVFIFVKLKRKMKHESY